MISQTWLIFAGFFLGLVQVHSAPSLLSDPGAAIDKDVAELEHLKHKAEAAEVKTEAATLEHQLEAEIEKLESTTESSSEKEVKPTVKNAHEIFHSSGEFSAFDMAQYIFWTGDEAGVAKAVEEFVQQGMISRENALKYLKEIHAGITYLESVYSSPDITERLNLKNKIAEQQQALKPEVLEESAQPTLSPAVLKTIENLPHMLKFDQLGGDGEKKDEENKLIDYDETNGRLRLADFLYAEYSLEEVIYQLAKTLFTQSLTQNSEQATTALQKLTGFLESEGQQGRIAPVLQKKILDVLLGALSDTLNEHPELLEPAKKALGAYLHKIPPPKTM